MVDAATIGTRLRREIRGLGYKTLAAFAADSGVPPSSLQKYADGKRKPGAEPLTSMAKAGVDVLFVLTGRERERRADREPAA